MENPQRFRNRKRYCCYYCNTYFYQVDAWQRHNRKHTGVEIECDDCGEMFSDHIDLKSHQSICEAHHVYSENVFTENTNVQNSTNQNKEHETPDSTSKQDSNNNSNNNEDDIAAINEKETSSLDGNNDTNENIESKSGAEFDDLIGEVKDENNEESVEEEDPDTEAMIGIDCSGGHQIDDNNNNNNKTDEQYNNEDDDSEFRKENNIVPISNDKQSNDDDHKTNSNSLPVSTTDFTFLNQISPVGGSNMENMHNIVLDHSDLNKKYQPYFCKNCGARFTRKDSVTRHLKKGTCSGKSAIVCNICGKIFPDVVELQTHFKLEHKNVVFTPPIVPRTILPRTESHEPQRYPPYHYDQHVSRPYMPQDQQYRPMPPGLQAMFYGGQNRSHRPASNNYGQPPNHMRDQFFQGKPIKMKYPANATIKKEHSYMNNKAVMMQHYNDEMHVQRKREYEYHHQEAPNDDVTHLPHKARKRDLEMSMGNYRHDKTSFNKNINLSEYTNNAMSSKQYYDNRFSSKEYGQHHQHHPMTSSKDESHAHRCKVCGLEFPRFEYLLTHLRKHKEKLEVDRSEHDDELHKPQMKVKPLDNHPSPIPHPVQYQPSDQFNHQSNNDSNSSSSAEDVNDKTNCISPQANHENNVRNPTINNHVSADQTPIVVPPNDTKIPLFNQTNNEMYTSHQDQLNMLTQQQNKSLPESFPDSIGAGIDGKFRPFICENCGQRFTRKDSLVRHAKKQTCFEEVVDLKCKHCDKTFRYHKCLIQHQELVHGIAPPLHTKEHSANPSDDEGSLSDKSADNNSETQKQQVQQKQEHMQNDFQHSNENHIARVSPFDKKPSNPSNEVGRNHFNPYNEDGHRASNPYNEDGHNSSTPYNEVGRKPSDPYNDDKRNPYNEDGRKPFDPYNADRRKLSIPYNENWRKPSNTFNEDGRKVSNPFNEDGRNNKGVDEIERLRRKHGYGYPTQAPNTLHQYPQQRQAFEANRPNQQTALPKFIPPKDIKNEKKYSSDQAQQGQDSNYIGYSVLQPRPFQCEYCGDRFAHRHSLKRHVRRHLGIGIPCHECGKLYRDQSEWRRHQLNIHNRRYEKYEVPSRMSFRDGVDQGLIGVLPNNNGSFQNTHDDSDSDRSEDDISPLARSSSDFTSNVATTTYTPTVVAMTSSMENDENKFIIDSKKEEREEKELRIKMFDFKSHLKNNDKDSRKSVLDSYLCPP